MIPFRSGRATIPELAVISSRRIASGGLTDQEAIDLTLEYRPKLVVFWSGKLAQLQGYSRWIERNYVVLREFSDDRTMYIIAEDQR